MALASRAALAAAGFHVVPQESVWSHGHVMASNSRPPTCVVPCTSRSSSFSPSHCSFEHLRLLPSARQPSYSHAQFCSREPNALIHGTGTCSDSCSPRNSSQLQQSSRRKRSDMLARRLGLGLRSRCHTTSISWLARPIAVAASAHELTRVIAGDVGISSSGSSSGDGGSSRLVSGASFSEGDALLSPLQSDLSASLDGGSSSSSGGNNVRKAQSAADYMADAELERVVADIAAIQQQSDVLAATVAAHARQLAAASRELSQRAQATRIEAAKVKKLARLQQAERMRQLDESRRERTAEVEARRQQLLRSAEEAAVVSAAAAAAAAAGGNGANWSAASGATAEELNGTPVIPFVFPNGHAVGREMDSAVSGGPSLVSSPPPIQPQGPVARNSDSSSGSRRKSVAAVEEEEVEEEEEEEEEGKSAEEELQPPLVNSGSTVSESMECVVVHPGAMSCTRTVVRKDPLQKMAVVSMETTVRCAGDGCTVAPLDCDDYAALAMASLAETAVELKHSARFQQGGVDEDPRQQQRRQEIMELLAKGDVVSAAPMEPPSKFGHESFVVRLRNPKTGKEMDAMFKPRVEGDADGWHRAPVEWAAYQLNLLLGMDYIPPVAYRRGGLELRWQGGGDGGGQGGNEQRRYYEEGAMVYWVANAKELRHVAAGKWGVSVARLLSDTRVLDVLLNNSDRHHGHFLFGQHWADGRMRAILIDHAAGFRREAVVKMEHENAFQTGPVRCVSAHTYLRLRFLDRAMVAAKLSDVLSDSEINQLMDRKDKVLAYLDGLVQERGYHRTVIE